MSDFRGYQQQDAHEFMRYLLDRLHTELLTLLPYPNSDSPFIGPKGKSTIVTAIFGGLLQNEVTCLVCGVESKKHDPFLGTNTIMDDGDFFFVSNNYMYHLNNVLVIKITFSVTKDTILFNYNLESSNDWVTLTHQKKFKLKLKTSVCHLCLIGIMIVTY